METMEEKQMKKTGPPGPRPKPKPRRKYGVVVRPGERMPIEDPNLYTLAIRDVGVGDKRYRVFFRTELATIDRIASDAVYTLLDGQKLEATKPTIYIETREVLNVEEKHVVKKITNPVKKKRKATAMQKFKDSIGKKKRKASRK